jgi:hypothetical protein
MSLLDAENIVNKKSIEIHNYIGNYLNKSLSDFKYNAKRRQLERKNEVKTDIIGWNLGKYDNNSLLIITFTLMIRHNFIDTLVEPFCNDKYFSQHSIYNDFVGEIGTDKKSKFNHYHIHSKSDFLTMLNEFEHFLKNIGTKYFDKYTKDNDFFNFYCIDKNYGLGGSYHASSFYYMPSYKRIMFCKLLEKYEMLGELNDYNIKCITSDEDKKYHDIIISNYYKKLKEIEESYNKERPLRITNG